jgi:1-acyl-sn-glycerol-3-phosphate acyltransferase
VTAPERIPTPEARESRHRSERPRGLLGSPSARASVLYRSLLAFFRVVVRVLRLQLVLEGKEHLPRLQHGEPVGGWIAAALPHRTWIDPFVLVLLLPVEPRLIFIGDGRAIFRSRVRRAAFRVLGGVVPIWPGGRGEAFAAHVRAAESVVRAGAVFVIFPEVGPPVDVQRARPLGAGLGYFALRTGAPIVPLVIGGAHELFIGRRIVLRVLPVATARDLAGIGRTDPLPQPDTPAERDAAHRIVARVHELATPAVAETFLDAEPPPGTRKRLRRLTTLFH